MKIRKQVYELTLEDLPQFFAWEFALDEEGEEMQDEATVRPREGNGPINPSDGMFIVRALFTLADGTLMCGYLTPSVQGNGGLGALQPVITTERGQIVFWCGGIAPDRRDLDAAYAKLQRAAATVFPIQMVSDVELVDGPICAVIPGFVVLEDWNSGKTRTTF